ncbi:MAG: hypothetical protein Fur0041_10600 [Bacteroidia bacterium]
MSRHIEMLDALFEHATEGILVCDISGTITMVNPAAAKMFGYAIDELNSQSIDILLPKRFRDGHHKHRDHYSQAPRPRAMGANRDLFGVKKDGTEFVVEVSLSPFETTEGKFIMSFIVDVTSRKKNEIELKLAHERLKQTSDALSQLNIELENKVQERTEELADAIQRLAESKKEVMHALQQEKELNELKSRFVTTASHEFRTPLGTILSSAALISKYEKAEEQEKRLKHIDRIKSAVKNLTEILNDFLSIEKLEEGVVRYTPQKVNLLELIQDTTDELRTVVKNGQTIDVEYCCEEETYIDPQLMKNVIINLLSNAIKYSPEEKPIKVKVEQQGNNIRMDFIDRGIGIPEKDQTYIFQRFFRAQNASNEQGTGLGLNIVKKYIDLMNGEISFSSKYGEGTTFTVIIPYANPQ